MKHLQRVVTFVVLALILAACGRQPSGAPAEQETVTVQRGTLRVIVNGSGVVQPLRSANLTFGINGTVREILVEEGAQVQQGQALARLDTRDLDANVAAAQAQVDQAQARLEQVQQNQAAPDSEVRVAEAALRQAEAQLTIAELNRDRATLSAPFDGIIADINLHVGDSVPMAATAGAPIRLIDTSALYVDANIGEADIARIETGQTAQIFIDAIGSEPISGTVTYIAPAATVAQNVATYPVHIDFSDDVPDLRVGMSASVEIDVAERQDALLVPNSAIRTESGRRIVRLQRDDTFVDTEVETSLSNDFETEIVSGLEEGDTIAAIGVPADVGQTP